MPDIPEEFLEVPAEGKRIAFTSNAGMNGRTSPVVDIVCDSAFKVFRVTTYSGSVYVGTVRATKQAIPQPPPQVQQVQYAQTTTSVPYPNNLSLQKKKMHPAVIVLVIIAALYVFGWCLNSLIPSEPTTDNNQSSQSYNPYAPAPIYPNANYTPPVPQPEQTNAHPNYVAPAPTTKPEPAPTLVASNLFLMRDNLGNGYIYPDTQLKRGILRSVSVLFDGSNYDVNGKIEKYHWELVVVVENNT